MSTRAKIRYTQNSNSSTSIKTKTIEMSYSEYDLFHLIGCIMYMKSKI